MEKIVKSVKYDKPINSQWGEFHKWLLEFEDGFMGEYLSKPEPQNKVIEGQKAKQIGVSQPEFRKLQKIAGDNKLLTLNKQISVKTSELLKPLRKQDEALNALETRIENKINKLLIEKKAIKGVGSKKKKSAIDKKIEAQNVRLETRTKEFNKAKKKIYMDQFLLFWI